MKQRITQEEEAEGMRRSGQVEVAEEKPRASQDEEPDKKQYR